jgi:hypothetical protein
MKAVFHSVEDIGSNSDIESNDLVHENWDGTQVLPRLAVLSAGSHATPLAGQRPAATYKSEKLRHQVA